MNNALWLLLALPKWYFSSVFAPLSSGLLSSVPAIGVVSFILGAGIGIKVRRQGLWLFSVPFLLCEALVAIAGIYRGQGNEAIVMPVVLSFMTVLLIFPIWIVWRLKDARLPAVLLAVFSLTYGLFAAFVAGMSFSDNWL